jgi:Tol biopolymer transport system component
MLRHAVALALASTLLAAPSAPAQRLSVLNVAPDGTRSDRPAGVADISFDGRFVLLSSAATNLAPGPNDTRDQQDLFLRDRTAGTTVRVSLTAAGEQPDRTIDRAAMSDDGRIVVFATAATNVVPGDTNGVSDVFVRDVVAGTTRLVSARPDGRPGTGASDLPDLTADGTRVVFQSSAPDLVEGDTTAASDVVLHRLDTGTSSIVSLDGDGKQVPGATGPRISADGRVVSFGTSAALLPDDTNGAADGHVRELATGVVERVTIGSDGRQGRGGHGVGRLSGDGRFATWSSYEGFARDDATSTLDVFLRDREKGTTEQLTLTADGSDAGNDAFGGAISRDGRFVTFSSTNALYATGSGGTATKPYLRDRVTGNVWRLNATVIEQPTIESTDAGSISGDGRVVVLSTTDPALGAQGFTLIAFDRAVRTPPFAVVEPERLFVRDAPVNDVDLSITAAANGFFVQSQAPTPFPQLGDGCAPARGPALCTGPQRVFFKGGDGDDRLNEIGCQNVTGAFDGGDGRDRLTGGPGAQTFFGGTGDDVLRGCGGPDDFFGQGGRDRVEILTAGPVVARIDGERPADPTRPKVSPDVEDLRTGPGDDRITGSSFDNVLETGAGADTLQGLEGDDELRPGTGVDDVVGSRGADLLITDDGEADTRVDCGADLDRAIVDLRDTPVNCETFEQAAVNEGPLLRLPPSVRRVGDRRVRLTIACPRALGHPCAGTVKVARTVAGLRRAPAARYRLRHGSRRTLTIAAGPGVAPGARAYVQSVERGDVRGVKTARRFARVRR